MIEYLCHNCLNYCKTKEDACPVCGAKFCKRDKITRSKLKAKAWNVFARYIILRDCISTTGKRDIGICYTCGKEFSSKDLQAGHLKTGRTYDILFDEDNVRAQCKRCNVMRNGEQGIFALKKVQELVDSGMPYHDAIDSVYSYLSRPTGKTNLTNEDLCNIIRKYTDKISTL